jgi:hypothetical protein
MSCPNACINAAHAGMISVKFDIEGGGGCNEYLGEKSQAYLKWTKQYSDISH